MNNAGKAADKIFATDGVKCLSLSEIEAIIQSAIEAALDEQGMIYAENHQKHVENLECSLFEANKRVTELEEQIRDSDESFKVVMEEKCPTDEIHCTCVPFLRERIAELEEAFGEETP